MADIDPAPQLRPARSDRALWALWAALTAAIVLAYALGAFDMLDCWSMGGEASSCQAE